MPVLKIGVDAIHLLHAEHRRVGASGRDGDASAGAKMTPAFVDSAIRLANVSSMAYGVDEIADADVVRAETDRRDGRVVEVVAEP